MTNNNIPARSHSIGQSTPIKLYYPLIKPHQIATYIIRGEYLKAAVLRNWELTQSNTKSNTSSNTKNSLKC